MRENSKAPTALLGAEQRGSGQDPMHQIGLTPQPAGHAEARRDGQDSMHRDSGETMSDHARPAPRPSRQDQCTNIPPWNNCSMSGHDRHPPRHADQGRYPRFCREHHKKSRITVFAGETGTRSGDRRKRFVYSTADTNAGAGRRRSRRMREAAGKTPSTCTGHFRCTAARHASAATGRTPCTRMAGTSSPGSCRRRHPGVAAAGRRRHDNGGAASAPAGHRNGSHVQWWRVLCMPPRTLR